MNIIFFGSSGYVIPIIKILQENFDLKLVFTTEKNLTDAVPAYCIENKIPYLSVSSSKNLINHSSLIINHSFLGVLADFGLIIPKEILNLFPKGIINIHPSLLPKYRGPTPVQTAILNGDKITGVSIMKVDEKIDHGPILTQEKEQILETDTAESLYKRLFEKGANLLPEALNKYIEGNLKPAPQNHEKATFTKPLTRQDGFIDISKLETRNSKLELERMIRAYFPWPGVWGKFKVQSSKFKVLKFLLEQKLQVEGKKPMSYKDFLNGYPEAKELLRKISLLS